jgi:hypothetical protein
MEVDDRTQAASLGLLVELNNGIIHEKGPEEKKRDGRLIEVIRMLLEADWEARKIASWLKKECSCRQERRIDHVNSVYSTKHLKELINLAGKGD